MSTAKKSLSPSLTLVVGEVFLYLVHSNNKKTSRVGGFFKTELTQCTDN